MSVKQGNPPPSLPSFASTFSNRSLSKFPNDDNSLPPIQSRSSNEPFRRVGSPSGQPLSRQPSNDDLHSRAAGRKRTHAESSSRDDDQHSLSDRGSPRVKEEPEQDMLEPSPPPPSISHSEARIIDNTSVPPPHATVLPSPLKKRRITVSGTPALNTDVRPPPDPANSTPISPVVIGCTIQRDNVDQVRSMISVKQKQQALIEQRRASVTGPTPAPPEDRSGAPAKQSNSNSSRPARRSPNAGGSSSRRHTVVSTTLPVPASPKTPHIPGQQSSAPPAHNQPPSSSVPAHSLPPPSISFARRRAAQLSAAGKKKPADILISPREQQTPEQFAPSIQSAPPVPQAGQVNTYAARMMLPRLPSVMAAGDNIRRTTAVNVPPTPTRFSLQRNSTSQVPQPIPGISGRSPPNASVPISSNLVPPTPHSLHHPGYSGEKSAFLAPFETFYDALNDSKQLKNWLSDQVQRSNTLMQSLTQQQEKMHEMVDALVEKRVSGMRAEMSGLHRRVEELEDALRAATSSRHGSIESAGLPVKNKGKQPLRNGLSTASGPVPMETYTFPPISNPERGRRIEPERGTRMVSPGWSHPQDRDRDRDRDTPSIQVGEGERGSPSPYDSRRLSVSADRSTQPRTPSLLGRSPPPPPMQIRDISRDRDVRDVPGSSSNLAPPLSSHGKISRPAGNMHRQHSSPRMSHLSERDRDRDRDMDRSASSPPRRLEDSRRNSIPGHTPDDRER
ncbi:hypothetical protein D9758_002562 [Tetrapyrgos nigripes]|uniref:Uncharacterized protein n=1 Tax=Tetrapyrgos nigripes TaxID=182062 RepID=A0A8H5LTR6_9AGAR|nr:hypothetical protein D9758_002562 [Tetrapyrgos nigripes]